ncbi:MAG: exodeoxyribonuclease IX [Gammaproteobacteria bacterium]|nr:exodeoxyribonuclease IX [Gammaproteobacteria bacterium]
MSPAGKAGVVHLVDASYFVFRAYHSLPAHLADADGEPTHALFGFALFLLDLLDGVRPERIAVAFDESLGGEASYRNSIYPAYKANREAAPPGLAQQFAHCRELCRVLGLAECASARYEADDLIGTLAAAARAAGLKSVLVTRDKDLAQLVREGDVFWDPAARARYGYEEIAARFGALPERMADYLALTGDPVDNVPGVPGVGPKSAARLFAEFASLEDLYGNLGRVARLPIRGAARLARSLAAHETDAYLARSLTSIVCDLPGVPSLDELRPRAVDPAIGAFLEERGLSAMLRARVERVAMRRLGDCA